MLLWQVAAAQTSDSALAALRAGGCVLVMRHASSPRTPPDPADADPGNVDNERQLDAVGRATAIAMGEALRGLRIPIGSILSSPTFRATETVRLLDVGEPELVAELGDGGNSMQADTEGRRSAWLRQRAAELPAAGTNVIIVTHLPNLTGAFGPQVADMRDGEALIVRPEPGGMSIIGRIAIDEWPSFAARGG